ncbi:MAG: hypothetical protein M3552_00495 [Planctomycetota bacterium]|nr:hypothetical protein [Planctomycetota bacterium]
MSLSRIIFVNMTVFCGLVNWSITVSKLIERLRKAVAERPDATLDELRIIVTPRKDRWKRLFDHAALRTAFGA